jgi:ubiquinone/menaquinone biosynthesis C-methylase UbiE
VGVEVDGTALELARRRSDRGRGAGPDPPAPDRELRLVGGDGRSLPFRSGSFDAVVSTLTLHHASDADAVVLLREMARVGRRIVVSDLERSLPAYLGARILARTRWRSNRFTRHDGPLSVRRSFTPSELLELGRRAGLSDLRVRRRALFRLVLEARGDEK